MKNQELTRLVYLSRTRAEISKSKRARPWRRLTRPSQKAVKEQLWIEICLEFALYWPSYLDHPLHSIHDKHPLCARCIVTHWGQRDNVTGYKNFFFSICWKISMALYEGSMICKSCQLQKVLLLQAYYLTCPTLSDSRARILFSQCQESIISV